MTERDFQEFLVSILENLCGYDCVVMADITPVIQGTYGTPDLYIRHPEKPNEWIEVKNPDSSRGCTPHQKRWHEKEITCGGNVSVIGSYADLRQWLDERGFAHIEVA